MRIATYCLAYGHILSCIWPHTVLRIATYCLAYCHILSCIWPHTVLHIATYCRAYCHILSCIKVQCYLPLLQLQSGSVDFSNGVCHVMNIIIAESNGDMALVCVRVCVLSLIHI